MTRKITRSQDLNFWHLGYMTGAAMGLPVMIVGGDIAKTFGARTAIISVIIGNIILWLIGHGILSMTEKTHHAVENVRSYLGTIPSIVGAIFWIGAYFSWYVIQLLAASSVIHFILPNIPMWLIGAVLGTITTFLCSPGIIAIKKYSAFSIPILIIISVFFLGINRQPISFEGTWGITLTPILVVVMTWFLGMVNLPTVFRFSKSKDDSLLGLTIMTLIHIYFQIVAILIGWSTSVNILSTVSYGRWLYVLFGVIFYFSINFINIYYAAIAWEGIVFRKSQFREFFIVGMLGTALYILYNIFSKVSIRIDSLEGILSDFIASLGVVLIVDFLIRVIVKHRPRPNEKFWSCACWIVGISTSLFFQFQNSSLNGGVEQYFNTPLVSGIIATILAFLILLFIEETVWAIRNIKKLKKHS